APPIITSAPRTPPADLDAEVASHNPNNLSNPEIAELEEQAEERVGGDGAGVAIWLIMVAANACVLVTLALGEDSKRSRRESR
ncbi:hypothetical protein FIBSPDRAFT_870665, partial [Athelia psychrophila]